MTTAAPLGPIDLDDPSVEWRGASVERRDLQLEFMYTVVLALVLALILALILAYAMFGRREGVEKRDQMTPETQMMQFNSIRRATTNLRLMSDRRQTPQPQVNRERYSSATLSPKRSSQNVYADRPATLPRQGGRRPGASIEYDITRDDERLVEETPNTVLSRDNPVMF